MERFEYRRSSVVTKLAMAVGVTVVQSISPVGNWATRNRRIVGRYRLPVPSRRPALLVQCKLSSRKKTPVAVGSTASGRRRKFCIKPPGGLVGPAEGSQEYVE